MNYINILIIPLIVYLLNTVIQFKNLLPSLSGEKHQLFVGSKKIPLSGGFIIIVTFLFLEKFNLEFYYLFSIMVFGIGFFFRFKNINVTKNKILPADTFYPFIYNLL